jgi:hypothetical protein
MLIAQEKRKSNIVEYLLYMYQVEDTIRACNFDINIIEERIITQYKVSEKTRVDIRNWYADLIVMMFQQKITKSGHLDFLVDIVDNLYALHLRIIEEHMDSAYIQSYKAALPNIFAFKQKLNKSYRNEVDICTTGLYALLLLRLQKKEISGETMEAMQTFSNMLAILGSWFLRLE